MTNWQSTIKIGDLHAKFDQDQDIDALTESVSKRIKRNKFWEEYNDLDNIAEDMLTVETVTEYDDCLRRLYDFGDYGHRIWIDSGKVGG